MGIEDETEVEEEEGQAEPQIIVYLGFLPAVSEGTNPESDVVDSGREIERARKRAARLSELGKLAGLVHFSALDVSEKDEGWRLWVSESGGRPAAIAEGDFEVALSKTPALSRFLEPSPSNELALLLTHGTLSDNAVALIVGRAMLINELGLTALTSRLLGNPWPGLALLAYIQIQKEFFAAGEAEQKMKKAEGLPPLTTFQSRWSLEAVHEWITGPSGKSSVAAYEEQLGSEAVKNFQALLDHLPTAGGLDESDLRSTSFSDSASDRDLLGFTSYVEAFKRTILHRETTTPLAIAVVGEWGKGKTSFMRFLRRELEKHDLRDLARASTGTSRKPSPLVPRAVTVWFDAWQYDSEEKVLAALLQTVAEEIQAHFTPYSWLKYRLVLAIKQLTGSWRVAYQLLLHVLVIPAMLMLATIAVAAFGPELAKGTLDFTKGVGDAVAKPDVWGSGGLLGVLYIGWQMVRRVPLPLGLDLNKLYEEKDHSERLGFLTVFKEEFSRRIEQMALMPTWSLRPIPRDTDGSQGTRGRSLLEPIRLSVQDLMHDLRNLVRRVSRTGRGSEIPEDSSEGNRVVVFIDDLDRCRPDKIVDILEAIKVSLDTTGIVFVLGMDDRYVKSGIYLRYKEHIQTREQLYAAHDVGDGLDPATETNGTTRRGDWWPNRYLEKVIQISFRIPDAGADDLQNLLAELLQVRGATSPERQEPTPPAAGGRSYPGPASREQQKQRAFREQILSEVDQPEINRMLLEAAAEVGPAHRWNPRRVKAFVNRCRLGLYLLKLDLPEMIQADYREAVDYFKQWELAMARGEAPTEPPMAQNLWTDRLQRIQQCLFALPRRRPPD